MRKYTFFFVLCRLLKAKLNEYLVKSYFVSFYKLIMMYLSSTKDTPTTTPVTVLKLEQQV